MNKKTRRWSDMGFARWLMLAALGFVSSLPAGGAWAQQPELDPETAAQLAEARAKHDLLMELAERHEGRFAQNININDQLLEQIIVKAEVSDVPGGKRVELPAEFCSLVEYFPSLWVRGERMEQTEGIERVQNGRTIGVKWNRYGQGLLLPMGHMQIDPGSGAHLILKGDPDPKQIEWVTVRVASRFDMSPFVGLGEDLPRERVRVNVSTRRWRSIGGISELDRSRYFRIYSEPNNERYPAYRSELEQYNFVQGRQIMKFNGALEQLWGEQSIEPLREDPDRPGYADPGFFERYDNRDYRGVPEDLRFAMCFDDWPSFMRVEIPSLPNTRGTPKDFDAAADLVVQYLNDQIRDSGRTATWWEVKNESDIQYEWTYHGDPNSDGWGLLADFHNTIADAVHSRVSEAVKIGGPTAAWPRFEHKNFSHWRNFARFHDETADHLDFYSYHFYYPPTFSPNDPHGYLDAQLDMIQSHMHSTDNVKPMLVTEFGTTGAAGAGTPDGKRWASAKPFSEQWMRYLDRPDEFDMVVPFMLGFLHWAPQSEWGVWAQDDDGRFYRTARHNVMKLWSEFQGRRVPVGSDNPRFLQHAVLDGDTLYVALSNQTDRRAAVDLRLDTDARISSSRQKRFYYSAGDLRYKVVRSPDLSALPVNVAETSILIIEFDRAPSTSGVLAERSFFGEGTAIPNTGEAIRFDIEAPGTGSDETVRAELRFSIHREGSEGLGESVSVTINGRTVVHSLERFGREGYFGYTRVPLPAGAIKDENRVAIRFAEPGGTLGSARLTVVSLEE